MHSQYATQFATSAILHSHMVQGLKSKNLILQGWNLIFFLQGGKYILTQKIITFTSLPSQKIEFF